MEVCIFWVNQSFFFIEVTFSSSDHNTLSPFPERLISVLVLVYSITLFISLIKHLISDSPIPHAGVFVGLFVSLFRSLVKTSPTYCAQAGEWPPQPPNPLR